MVWLLLVVTLLVSVAASIVFDCGRVPTAPGDRRNNKSRVVVAHWNVEWLFADRWERRWQSAEEAQQHLFAVADAIAAHPEVDIWHLAEVEDCAVLRQVARADPTLAAFLVRGTDSATGQQVGILSRVDPVALFRSDARARYPVAGTMCGSSRSGTSGVSKHLVAHFRPSVFPAFSLIGAHLLAHPSDPDRCVQREAQATVLQSLIQKELAHTAHVAVVGDFNDYDSVIMDARSSKSISQTLALMKDAIQELPGDELHNAAMHVNQSLRYTSYRNEENLCAPPQHSSTAIDHILLSTSLARLVTDVRFGTRAFDAPCRSSRMFSDHWPVFVTLTANGEAREL